MWMEHYTIRLDFKSKSIEPFFILHIKMQSEPKHLNSPSVN